MNSDLKIAFRKNRPLERCLSKGSYDDDLDSIVSIFDDICSSLSETENVEFIVQGFGQKQWPVDIETDLSVVLEQLGSLCHFLSSGTGEGRIDFYEQGMERSLIFEYTDGDVEITCISHTDWQPNPKVHRIKHTLLA